jgi:hypothetical protein
MLDIIIHPTISNIDMTLSTDFIYIKDCIISTSHYLTSTLHQDILSCGTYVYMIHMHGFYTLCVSHSNIHCRLLASKRTWNPKCKTLKPKTQQTKTYETMWVEAQTRTKRKTQTWNWAIKQYQNPWPQESSQKQAAHGWDIHMESQSIVSFFWAWQFSRGKQILLLFHHFFFPFGTF